MVMTIIFALLFIGSLFLGKIELSKEKKIPKAATLPAQVLMFVVLSFTAFKGMMFYAEPTMVYHVRTITGSEKVVANKTGFAVKGFGRVNEWKRAMTITAAGDSTGASAGMAPLNIMFLDQVDALAEATVRFSIPTDQESFLRLAHEYRSPENLLRSALIPAFKETLQANASTMSAEEYYAGGRTEFNNEFETQMTTGVYLVERNEVTVASKVASGSANVTKGTAQDEFGEDETTEFIVERILDENGQPKIKNQKFLDFGITVVDARVTDMKPNAKFVERMQLKQKASADRAIAREQRVQEEEQRLLAIAKGDREVAERQAQAKVVQIEKTTNAETEKQLAITSANKLKEQAEIAKETAAIELEKARIEAETKRTLADAEAYAKEQILKADNALAQKLEAEIAIQEVWAKAFAQRKVPTTVFGASDSGMDSDAQAFMQLMTMDAAKRLNYDREVSTTK